MMKSTCAAVLLALNLIAVPALAEDTMDHSKMDHASMNHGDSPFAAVNADMHKAMDIAFTGDIDKDFVRSMIPHHEGAVAMAKIVLQQGKDPEIRALADAIVKAQETEIAQMKDWLAQHPD